MKIQDFDFDLPDELIAQTPAERRGASRLLVMDGAGDISDRKFGDLPSLLEPGDLLVFNDTRVIRARLFGKKDTGGSVEVMVERILDEECVLASIRASHAPKPGSVIHFDDASAKVLERRDEFYVLSFGEDAAGVLERCGKLPLPPYISHAATEYDEDRYQTVYAKNPGAVAAPTAGLHFDEAMLQNLADLGVNFAHVTLHVGAGTFKPVRVENISEHVMHSEVYDVPAEVMDVIRKTKDAGKSVIPVGTTALRALESAALYGNLRGETGIFITPGYQFRVADRLLTNFHLPKSTLLMLVSAFSGLEEIRNAYRHAVENRYRFFSYGDAMLIDRKIP